MSSFSSPIPSSSLSSALMISPSLCHTLWCHNSSLNCCPAHLSFPDKTRQLSLMSLCSEPLMANKKLQLERRGDGGALKADISLCAVYYKNAKTKLVTINWAWWNHLNRISSIFTFNPNFLIWDNLNLYLIKWEAFPEGMCSCLLCLILGHLKSKPLVSWLWQPSWSRVTPSIDQVETNVQWSLSEKSFKMHPVGREIFCQRTDWDVIS